MGSAWNGDRNSRVWRQLFRRPLALSRDTLTAMINIKLSLLRRNPETLACHHTLQHADESLRQLRHRLCTGPPPGWLAPHRGAETASPSAIPPPACTSAQAFCAEPASIAARTVSPLA